MPPIMGPDIVVFLEELVVSLSSPVMPALEVPLGRAFDAGSICPFGPTPVSDNVKVGKLRGFVGIAEEDPEPELKLKGVVD